jgi:hypothetical protein
MEAQFQTLFLRLANAKERVFAGGEPKTICLHKDDLIIIARGLLQAILQEHPELKKDAVFPLDKTELLNYALDTTKDLFGCPVQVTDEDRLIGHIQAEFDEGEVIELVL